MKSAHFKHVASDGKPVFIYHWLPRAAPKALVVIAHGMAEHAARYERLAAKLTAAGFAVWAPDHRGHGLTAASPAELGYFADKEGFRRVVDDLHEVAGLATGSFPGLPLFLLGHSMGSILSQAYIALYGEGLAGCILSGTSGPLPLALSKAGALVAALGCLFKGRHAVAPLADKMSFGNYNKAFMPARTAFDWLSRDEAEVDKYVADPLCGFVCRYGFFADLLAGLAFTHRPATMAAIPLGLPVLLVSGAADPVGGATGSVDALASIYRKAGMKDVEMKLYPEARHEILNETNREEVVQDILDWIEKRYSKGK